MASVNVGDKVVVAPRSREARAFWQFVDGWRGVVFDFQGGYVGIQCMRPDGVKTLYVEPENLALTV